MLSSLSLPPEQRQIVDAELTPGEALLWAGQPAPGRMARMGIVPMLVGIPFTAFALFWTAGAGGFALLFGGVAHQAGAGAFAALPLVFPLFGLIFVAAGVGMLLSPLWLTLKAGRTLYAVTDKRVLLWSGGVGGGRTVRSLSPAQLGDRARTQNADGGDLVFPRAATLSTYTDSGTDAGGFGYSRTRTQVNQVGFYGIPDVKAVDDLLRQTFG